MGNPAEPRELLDVVPDPEWLGSEDKFKAFMHGEYGQQAHAPSSESVIASSADELISYQKSRAKQAEEQSAEEQASRARVDEHNMRGILAATARVEMLHEDDRPPKVVGPPKIKV